MFASIACTLENPFSNCSWMAVFSDCSSLKFDNSSSYFTLKNDINKKWNILQQRNKILYMLIWWNGCLLTTHSFCKMSFLSCSIWTLHSLFFFISVHSCSSSSCTLICRYIAEKQCIVYFNPMNIFYYQTHKQLSLVDKRWGDEKQN